MWLLYKIQKNKRQPIGRRLRLRSPYLLSGDRDLPRQINVLNCVQNANALLHRPLERLAIGVHAFVDLPVPVFLAADGGVTAVIFGKFLLDDVRLDGNAEVVGLAGQVGADVVVLVALEGGIAQVAAEHGGRPHFVRHLEAFRHFDVLPGAGAPSQDHRGQQRDQAVQRRVGIRYRQGQIAVRDIAAAGSAIDQTLFCVHDRGAGRMLRFRSVAIESRDRQHDELRIEPAQLVVAWHQPRHHTRAIVLDQHVGLANHIEHQFARTGRAQIESDVAFAGILLMEIARHAADDRSPLPRGIAVRRLDFYDVGAEIA